MDATHYAPLHSLSFLPGPSWFTRSRSTWPTGSPPEGPAKLAVVIIDGLAMDQWAVARQEMPPRKWVTEEFGVFAWVPTLTSVSRQSIFAGDPLSFLRQSLDTTRKEEQHWTRFWEDRGLRKGDAVYLSGYLGRRRRLSSRGSRKDRPAPLSGLQASWSVRSIRCCTASSQEPMACTRVFATGPSEGRFGVSWICSLRAASKWF